MVFSRLQRLRIWKLSVFSGFLGPFYRFYGVFPYNSPRGGRFPKKHSSLAGDKIIPQVLGFYGILEIIDFYRFLLIFDPFLLIFGVFLWCFPYSGPLRMYF